MRLPFVLADFTRIIWHSEDARSVWAPRIAKINQVWGQMERQAVVEGVRDACLTFVDPQNLPEVSLWAAVRGLVVLPLATNGVASQYSSTSTAVVAGRPFQYRIVLTRPEFAERWAKAWAGELDNQAVGEMLGYPPCCRAFFEQVWVKDKGVDTTWEMGCNSAGEKTELSVRIPYGSPPEANIMLRWLGVRLVPHLPCSFGCSATVHSAQQFAELARKEHPEVVAWIYEMLEWPIEWSSLHGIAEVRTPVLTISTRSNATGKKIVVQREGTNYPEEGASGLRFPFRVVTGQVTSKPSFKRSVSPVHELNGFGSEASMIAAHDTLLSVLPTETGFLLDLGCGTGRLLERAEALGWTAVGVESDNARAGAAKVPVRRGDLLDVSLWKGEYDVIAFMPGRLLEDAADDKATAVRQSLLSRARAVLLYAYGDWLSKYGGLGPLAAAAGLGAGEVLKTAQADGVEAALVVFNQEQRSNESVAAASVNQS
jgi:hypothetical protein